MKYKLPECATFFTCFDCGDYFVGAKIDYADIATTPVDDVSILMVKANAFRRVANTNSSDSFRSGYVNHRDAVILRVSDVKRFVIQAKSYAIGVKAHLELLLHLVISVNKTDAIILHIH